VRALEWDVWTTIDKTDFVESIYARFILPRKERRSPVFRFPSITELSDAELQAIEAEVEAVIDAALAKNIATEARLFPS